MTIARKNFRRVRVERTFIFVEIIRVVSSPFYRSRLPPPPHLPPHPRQLVLSELKFSATGKTRHVAIILRCPCSCCARRGLFCKLNRFVKTRTGGEDTRTRIAHTHTHTYKHTRAHTQRQAGTTTHRGFPNHRRENGTDFSDNCPDGRDIRRR